ncbi:MAG: response regulator [Fluviicola sp.]|jgi:two-component system chemotaxis response regulator CheY|nr:response regulator [Fluviicola sp.]
MAKNILIVDDSESIREVVGLALRSEGYNVVVGVDGQHGLELLLENKNVNLIISDLNMPRLDGISFLKEVRKLDAFKYLPILILTTESQETKKIEAKNSGATGWIIKPFVKEKLLAVVKKVLR